jgi:hypothetical protein
MVGDSVAEGLSQCARSALNDADWEASKAGMNGNADCGGRFATFAADSGLKSGKC